MFFQRILELQSFFKKNLNFNSIDFRFAQLLAEKETHPDFQNSIFLLTLLLSQRLNQGAIFLDEAQFKEGYQKILAYLEAENKSTVNFTIRVNFFSLIAEQNGNLYY